MGNEIYHMNVYAMSTVVSATKTDIDNLLRTFEGLEKKYPLYEKKCRDLVYRQFALFPVKDNPTDEEFYVQSLEKMLEDEERKKTEEEAASKAEEASVKDVGVVDEIKERGDTDEIKERGDTDDNEIVSVASSKFTENDDNVSVALSVASAESTTMKEKADKIADMYTEHKLLPEKGHNLPSSYIIRLEDMKQLCKKCNWTDEDVEVLEAFFRLADVRGYDEADLRFVLMPFAMCVCKESLVECMLTVFSIFDRPVVEAIEKTDFIKIMNQLNEGVLYMGDKHLEARYIVDLTDSLWTSSGKIDGYIAYPEFVELLCQHPIIQMFLTPQYQGLARDKVFDDTTLSQMDALSIDVDYSQKTF